jgi:hypothetical protein
MPNVSLRPQPLIVTCCTLFCASIAWSAPEFTPEQLKLPGKKGACYSLPLVPGGNRTPAETDAIRKEHARQIAALDVSWNYSWNIALVDEQPASVEFLPMVFGGSGLHGPDAPRKLADQLAVEVTPHVRSGRVVRLLGPNEPDRVQHGNLSVEQALALWPTMEALGVPLGSPSAANTLGGKGFGGHWMPDFMEGVERRGLRVDYIGAHAYSGPNPAELKKRLQQIHEKYGKRPLLVTEFGVADWATLDGKSKNRHTPAQVLKFIKDVLPWMERQDWIAGYAWFPYKVESPHGTSSALFDSSGELTAVGRFYRSVTPDNPDGDQSIQPD